MLLLSAMKRRWPVLTTVVVGLLWLQSHYNIRGLDGLRLEPKSVGSPSPGTYPNATTPWPMASTGVSAGPPLPGMSPAGTSLPALPGSDGRLGAWSQGGGLPGTSPSTAGYPTAYPSTNPLPPLAGAGALPGIGASQPNGIPVPGQLNVEMLRPAINALAGEDWNRLLSVGEKLGMLERTRQPATPLAASGAVAAAASAPAITGWPGGGSESRGARDSIRIASFNLSGWGDANRSDLFVQSMIERLMGQFDVIALQDVRSRRDDLLPGLVSQLNRSGRQYDFMIGPRVGRGDHREQLAFVFDTQRIETDRFQLYTVDDPEDMLSREPLVGWFRAGAPDSREAFTFSLVNVHIDPDLAASELQALPNLVEAIVADGRGEDDVILAGDFHAAAPHRVLTMTQFRAAIEDVATDTPGTALLDNILMPSAAATEYTGRSGSIDFLRQFNLSLEQALTISRHLPIWAEFSIIEGGRPGQVAGNALPARSTYGGLAN